MGEGEGLVSKRNHPSSMLFHRIILYTQGWGWRPQVLSDDSHLFLIHSGCRAALFALLPFLVPLGQRMFMSECLSLSQMFSVCPSVKARHVL